MTRDLLQYLLLFCTLFFGVQVNGQSYDFHTVLSGETTSAEVKTIAYSSNGDFIYAAGFMDGAGDGDFSSCSVTTAHGQNGFLVKYTSAGVQVWGFDVGHGDAAITAIDVDAFDNVVIAGWFEGSTGNHFEGTSGGASSLTSTGGKDVFIAKYNPSGVMIWLHQGTSSGDDYIHDIEVDQNNDIYIAGSSFGTFNYNGNNITSYGGSEAYALKISASGSFIWMNSAGTNQEDQFTSVTIFGGNAYFGGYFKGAGTGKLGSLTSLSNISSGTSEMMIAQYNKTSGADVNAVTFGGVDEDVIHGLSNDGTNIYFTGSSLNTLTIGSDIYSNPYQEIVVAKLDNGLNSLWSTTTTHGGSGSANGWDVDFIGANRVSVAGDYSGPLNSGSAIATTPASTGGIVLTYNASTGTNLSQTVISGTGEQSAKTLAHKSVTEIYTGGTYINNAVFSSINVSGNNGYNHPFVGILGCVAGTATATLSGNGTICSGASTDLTFTFTGDLPYSITYNDGSADVTVTGILTSTLTIAVTPAATTTTTYTITAFSSGSCSSIFSGTATITIVSSILNNIIYSDTTHCGPSSSVFTGELPVGASGGGISYYWQYKNIFNSWVGVAGTNGLQGYSSTSDNVTRQYRRLVNAPGCATSVSNILTATIVSSITNNGVSGDQQSCGDFDPVSFVITSPSGGTGSYIYNWESDTDPNFPTPTTVGTNAAYNPPVQTQTLYFRRIVESSACFDTTNYITVEIDPEITSNTISTDETICGPSIPNPLTGLAVGGGDGSYVYTWQSSTDDVTWTNVGSLQNYSPGTLSTTTAFRRYINSGLCSDTSNKVIITVDVLISGNTITPPAVTSLCTGSIPGSIIGTAPTGGDNSNYTFAWEESFDNLTWGSASGANNGNDYNTPILTDTIYYRRIASSGACANSISNVVTINVYPLIANNKIYTSQTICANTTPAILTGDIPTGGNGGAIIYNWQSSTDNVNFNMILSTNSVNYQPSALATTTYFRRRVERGLCGMNFSDTISIIVEPVISNNIISADQILCGTSLAGTLDGAPATGGTGTMSYTWFSSTDSSTWTNAASTEDYSPGIVTITTYYFRIVTSGACSDSDTSNVIAITVEDLISGNSISADHSICTGTQPNLLDGTVAVAGSYAISYVWEQSGDSSAWVLANGTMTAEDFQPFVITDTMFYRRLASTGLCPNDTSNVTKVSAEDSVGNNILTSPPTLCSNDNTGVISGSIPTNGDGTYTYEWEKSADNVIWSPIASSNTQNFSIGGITVSTYFRRIVTSGECGSMTSASVYQVVSPFITTNTIGYIETICSDSIPTLLFGAVQSPGAFDFSWQDSTDGSPFSISSGIFGNASYQAGNLTETTFYRRIMKSGACPNDTSNLIEITVLDTISNNVISEDSTVCYGTSGVDLPGTLPVGGDGNYAFGWESSTDGITYTTASGIGGSISQGFTTGVLTQTTYFRRTVFGIACSNDSLLSNVITITVETALANNTISSDQFLCGNYNAATLNGLPVTGGSGVPDYQWQSSLDLGTWNNIAATTEDFSPGTIADTLYYRRLASSGACSIADTSNIVSLIYLNILFPNSILDDDTICYGTAPAAFNEFLPVSGGDGTYSFEWIESTDSLIWVTASGTGTILSFAATALNTSTYYRRVLNSSTCPADTSNTLYVVVEDSIDNNTLIPPADICSSNTTDSLMGSAPSGGNGVFTYLWQIYDSLGMNWVSAPFVNSNEDYAIGQVSDSAYYRRIVSSGECGSDISNVVLLAVHPFVDTNTIFNDQSICMNTSPQLLTGEAPTGNGFVYTWESSMDNVNFTLEVSGISMQNFQPGVLDSTTYYRRIIYSGVCDLDTSNTLTITVWDSLTDNTISQDTTVCFNVDQIALTGSVISGGSGNTAFLWEVSTNGINFATPTVNFTSQDYTTGVLTQNTYYRRVATDIDCPNDTLYSNIVAITVHSEITHSYNIEADTVCIGDDVDLSFLITGDAPYAMAYSNDVNYGNPTGIIAPGYNLIFTPAADGLIILDTIWDANGCFIEPADTFYYRVVTYPVVDMGFDTTVCDSYVFNPSFGSGTLDFTSSTLGVLNASFPQDFTPSTYGTHEFVITETVENCANSDTVVVNFEEGIGFISAGEDQFIVIQDSTQLVATDLFPGQNGYWALISGGGNFGDTIDPSSSFLNLISGVTILEWTVEQDVCPSVSDQVNIVVQNLLIPTGFSPNGDGDNDFLEVAGREDLNTIYVQVFDRWGGLVYEDKDYQNDWYGTAKSGEPLPEDTYFVIIDLGEKGIHKSYLIIRK